MDSSKARSTIDYKISNKPNFPNAPTSNKKRGIGSTSGMKIPVDQINSSRSSIDSGRRSSYSKYSILPDISGQSSSKHGDLDESSLSSSSDQSFSRSLSHPYTQSSDENINNVVSHPSRPVNPHNSGHYKPAVLSDKLNCQLKLEKPINQSNCEKVFSQPEKDKVDSDSEKVSVKTSQTEYKPRHCSHPEPVSVTDSNQPAVLTLAVRFPQGARVIKRVTDTGKSLRGLLIETAHEHDIKLDIDYIECLNAAGQAGPVMFSESEMRSAIKQLNIPDRTVLILQYTE